MFSIHRKLFLFLKKVRIFKITPSQVPFTWQNPSPSKKSPPTPVKFLIPPFTALPPTPVSLSPPLTAIWKTLGCPTYYIEDNVDWLLDWLLNISIGENAISKFMLRSSLSLYKNELQIKWHSPLSFVFVFISYSFYWGVSF